MIQTNRDGARIPRNAIRMSINDDSRFQASPAELTSSLRLNGAGPNAVHPLDWYTQGQPCDICGRGTDADHLEHDDSCKHKDSPSLGFVVSDIDNASRLGPNRPNCSACRDVHEHGFGYCLDYEPATE